MSHALTKQKHLDQIKRLLLMHPEGISMDDIRNQVAPEMDWSSIWRFVVKDLQAQRLSKGIYTLEPNEDDIQVAVAVLNRAGLGHRFWIDNDEAYRLHEEGMSQTAIARL